ncbi:MAG TPA: hypothetical protein VGC09_11435 [Rhodopila sp.]
MTNRLLIVLASLLGASACTGPSLYAPLPQSAFATPNSDVVPLGHVRATVSRSYIAPFQTPDFGDATMRRDAYAQALKGTDGDLIIDGDFSMRSTIIPVGVQIYSIQGTVEGTAARIATVGYRPKSAASGN